MSVKFIPSDTFKHGCMLCANQKVSIFNPDGKTTVEYTVESTYQAGNSFLFVRDTSVEVDKNEMSSLGHTEKLVKTKFSSQETEKHNLGKFLCRKKVDNTNTLEREKWHRDKEYKKRVKKALKYRKLWNKLVNTVEKMNIKDVATSRGPEWYQDLSHDQIKSLRMLQDILKADLEEGIVARTKRFLTSLGVSINIPSGKVYKSNKGCDSDPIYFLLEMYNEVVEIEGKTRPDLGINEYSVNQQLLLSSICTLHLPLLLNLMHLLLPPPVPGSIALVKTLFDSERYRYSQPHLEPLPNRTTKRFNLLTKQLSKHIQYPMDRESEQFEEGDKEEENYTHHMLSICEENEEQAASQRTEYNNVVSKFQITSKKFYVRRDTNEKGRDVSGDLARIVQNNNMNGMNECSVSSVPRVSTVLSTVEGVRMSALPPRKTHFSSTESDVTNQLTLLMVPDYDHRVSLEVGVVNANSKQGNSYLGEKGPSGESQLQQTGSLFMKTIVITQPTSTIQQEDSVLARKTQQTDAVATQSEQPQTSISQREEKSVTNESKQRDTDKEKTQAMLDEKKAKKERVQAMLNRIAATPVKQQLQCVISLLAEAGDPLALFPDVHRIPSVRRWFELRRGIKRLLTKKENDELMDLTMTMWKNTPVIKKLKIPKLNIPKAEQKLLTWDDHCRVRKKVNEQLSLYFIQMKEQRVNNTRALFPAMLNQYYVSKLNRQFRKVFYTYLPAKAADMYVYRPWQMDECKPKPKFCY